MQLDFAIAEDDAALAVIKLKRQSLHPGVLAALLAEAGIAPSAYVRGLKNHVWRVTVAEMEAFKAFLATFTPETFQAKVGELRKAFPPITGHLTPQAAKNQEGPCSKP